MKISFDLYTNDITVALTHFERISLAAKFDGWRGDSVSLAPQDHNGTTIYCLNGQVDYRILEPQSLKAAGFVSDADDLDTNEDDGEEVDWNDL